jgi:hypothetical protein
MAQRTGITREFMLFLRHNRAYWLVPIILVALVFAALVALGVATGGAATPFIYVLF